MTIMDRLTKANQAVEQLVSKHARALKLTPLQLQALLALYTHQGQTAAEIARGMGAEKDATAHLVQRMVRRKLVKQKAHKDDGRAQGNYLTKSGMDTAIKVHGVVMEVELRLEEIVQGSGQFMSRLDRIAELS